MVASLTLKSKNYEQTIRQKNGKHLGIVNPEKNNPEAKYQDPDFRFLPTLKTCLLKGLSRPIAATIGKRGSHMAGNTSNICAPRTGNSENSQNPLIFQIGTKNYAHPDYVAKLLNVTRRTLNRWTQDRKGPPKIIVGQKSLYDLDKLALWLEGNEIHPLPQLQGNK